ncbi:MAG TPA: LysR family transcriptional regulator, partial [Clostridium sp.]
MDIRHFKTFKSIIEEGNFSNAAMKLGYTQSTVTSQIQQLEQELSIKLFEKIGRNM